MRATHAPSAATIGGMADETSLSHAMHGKRTPRAVDRAIAELAERQHGVVGRGQLMELGVGRGAIEGRIARGQLHRIHQGSYAVGHRLSTRHGRWMAAVLSAGPRAVLSHRSAGQLWQLLRQSPSLPELTRPTRFRSRPGLRAHCSLLPPDEIALVERIPVTSVPRTLLDLSIPDLLERYPRRSGSAALWSLMHDETAVRGITRNKLEERFVALLDGAALPRPRLNAHVAVRDRFFEADCLWAEQRLIVELDGRQTHRTGRAFEKDRERDRLLLADGWRVTRVTWRQLRDDAPAVLADLRRMLLG